jgi:hypothetical protein
VNSRPVRKALGLGQVQAQRLGQVLEQRQPVPHRDRQDDQPVLVDQPVPGQRLHERGAAVGHNHTARLALEQRNLLGQVTLPAAHPLAGQEEVAFKQLWDEPFVAAPAETGCWRDYWLATDERPPGHHLPAGHRRQPQPGRPGNVGTMELDGVRALVTGGTSGLGFAMSQALAQAGARVVLTGRTEQRIGEAASRIGDLVTGLVMDVRDEQSVTAGVDAARAALGDGIDVNLLLAPPGPA